MSLRKIMLMSIFLLVSSMVNAQIDTYKQMTRFGEATIIYWGTKTPNEASSMFDVEKLRMCNRSNLARILLPAQVQFFEDLVDECVLTINQSRFRPVPFSLFSVELRTRGGAEVRIYYYWEVKDFNTWREPATILLVDLKSLSNYRGEGT